MTYQELRKALKEGKTVSKVGSRYYIKAKNRKLIASPKDENNDIELSPIVLCLSANEILDDNIMYEIYEKPILDKAEKKYLSDVVRPFRKDYEIQIKKCLENNGKEFITIITKKLANSLIEYVYFPFFEKGEMYKGMKAGKGYTLEELGL